MKCCNRSSLKPARPMCDGRPCGSPLFRRLAGRGPFFAFRRCRHSPLHAFKWPVAPPAGSDHSSVSLSHEDPNDEHPEDALPTLPHLRLTRDALEPPQIQRGSLDRNTCVHSILGEEQGNVAPGSGMSGTGGGGLARVPNLRVCKHLFSIRGGTRRGGGMN